MRLLSTFFGPYLKILTTNFASSCGFAIPKKGYFIKFELFSSPRGQEFDQRNSCKTKRSIKCCTYSRNRSPLPHPVCPNIDTCIRNPLHVGGGGVSHNAFASVLFNCIWAAYRYATLGNNTSCNVFYIQKITTICAMYKCR